MTNQERKERIESLLEMVNTFEITLDDAVSEGKDIVRGCRQYGGSVGRQGASMDSYLINRLQNFIQGYEQFRFDGMRVALEQELQEIEAGVYDEEATAE